MVIVWIVWIVIAAILAYVAMTGDEDVVYFLGAICLWMGTMYIFSIIHYTIGG